MQAMQDDFSDRVLEEVAAHEDAGDRASSCLKSRIYSALMKRQAASGPLLGLPATRAAGRDLCVFELLTSVAPVGEMARRLNICRVCHARVLAEQVEHAPIHWAGCPYVDFQKG
jgi:hypothetical protein